MPFFLNKPCVTLMLLISCYSASAAISMQTQIKAPRHNNQQSNMCSYTHYLGRWVAMLTGNDVNPDGIIITESSLVFDNGKLIPHSVLSTSSPIVLKPQLDHVTSPTVYLLYAEQCNSNRMCLSKHSGSTTAATDSEPTALRCYTRPKNAEVRQ